MEKKLCELNSLISSIVTIYTLILLYLPHIFLKLFFSPVLISTAILLIILFRLGAVQKNQRSEAAAAADDRKCVESKLDETVNAGAQERFVEWDFGAPLEVIYECEEDDDLIRERFDKYPSLSMYYPDSDTETETSSEGEGLPFAGEWESPEKMSYRWDEEEREGLIEIALDDDCRRNSDFDEDNMIEIFDVLPPGKNTQFLAGQL